MCFYHDFIQTKNIDPLFDIKQAKYNDLCSDLMTNKCKKFTNITQFPVPAVNSEEDPCDWEIYSKDMFDQGNILDKQNYT